MTNGDGGPAVLTEVVAAVARAYGWKGFESRTVEAAPLTAAQRAEAAGSYGKGAFQIIDAGAHLEGRAGGNQFALIPLGSDAFVVPETGGSIRLSRGPDGQISAVSAGSSTLARDR